MGFNATMLLWLKVNDSNLAKIKIHFRKCLVLLVQIRYQYYLQIVLWLSEPTPEIFSFARACPTSHWVTPSLIRLCLNLEIVFYYWLSFLLYDWSMNTYRSANASSSLGSASKSPAGSAGCEIGEEEQSPNIHKLFPKLIIWKAKAIEVH